MSVNFFVDTNILVYTRDAAETEKQPLAMLWLEYLWKAKSGRLSIQVLQEFYSIVTTKLKPGMEPQQAREDLLSLSAWNPVHINLDIIKNAWSIIDKFRISWWDSLIVSAAQTLNCDYLLTEDLQENQIFGSVQVINPFNNSPESLK